MNCHFKNENEIFACSRPISVSGKLGNVRKSYIFHYTSSEICASHKGLLFFVRYYTGIFTVSALCSLHLQAKLYVCTTSFIRNFLWLNGLLSERCLCGSITRGSYQNAAYVAHQQGAPIRTLLMWLNNNGLQSERCFFSIGCPNTAPIRPLLLFLMVAHNNAPIRTLLLFYWLPITILQSERCFFSIGGP